MRFLTCGREAVMVEVADLASALSLYAALQAAALPGVTDLVPAARTVLIHFDPSVTSRAAVQDATAALRPSGFALDGGRLEIPVVYDGPDLASVAAEHDMSPGALIEWHTSTAWTVAFGGFAPGFGYLTGGELDVRRRDTPRARIPAGSVALAGRYSGVYPQDGPGGWQLIGRTGLRMWDLEREPPALLVPGVGVTFRQVSA